MNDNDECKFNLSTLIYLNQMNNDFYIDIVLFLRG